ncbi:LOW QUALITY PROTEIN: DAZ-associated protein 2 [Callospermophilus lateralis]
MNSKGQYPMQPAYPVQPPGMVHPQTLHLPQAPACADAPPAHSELYLLSFVHPGATTFPTMSAAFPGTSLYLPMAQSVAVGPLGSTDPMAYYPVGPISPPGSVLVEGGLISRLPLGAVSSLWRTTILDYSKVFTPSELPFFHSDQVSNFINLS